MRARPFRCALWALVCGLAAAAAPTALAERADRQKPMQLEADHMQHDEPRQLTVLSGHVQAAKGTLLIRAARMEVQQSTNGHHIARMSAVPGDRIFFRQKREGLDEFIEGYARQAVYNSQADEMVLSEQAEVRMVRQGGGTAQRIEGQRIVYNSHTETLTVDGSPQQASSNTSASPEGRGRVRAVLSPPAAADAPLAAPNLRVSTGGRP